MTDEKKIEEEILEDKSNVKKTEPARNATHSDAGGEEIKDEKKSIFKRSKKHECREEEYLFGWKRCLADFENYKKRQVENQKNIGEYLKEDSALQIIPVIDNFHSATEHIPEEQKNVPWVVGIMYIQKQLEDVLKENGVVEMDVKVGDEFDPNLHEAVANSQETRNKEQETMEEENTNKITRVVLKGYKLNEKVIRAARVIVE